MRLDAEQTSALEYALNLVTDEVYLFGSRLDPAKIRRRYRFAGIFQTGQFPIVPADHTPFL